MIVVVRVVRVTAVVRVRLMMVVRGKIVGNHLGEQLLGDLGRWSLCGFLSVRRGQLLVIIVVVVVVAVVVILL